MAKKAAAFILLFIAFWRTAPAQTITAKLDRDKIVLGEQVTLELKLEGLNTANSFLTDWFNLADTGNHIQVIRRDTVDTIEVAGLTSYLQHITITSFDSGKWAIPFAKLFIQNKATGKKTALKAENVFLQVLPVDVSSLQDYHDVKDIIDVPVRPSYGLWVAGIISAIAVIVLAVLLFKRKRKPLAAIKKPSQFINPIDEALQKIYELKQAGLPAKGQAVLFYTRLDDICRAYFTKRMQIKAMQCTSDELIIKLNVYLQNRDTKTKFCQLLRLADAVKFAKYLPAEQQHEEALQYATASLQYIETQLQIANRHVN